MRKALGATLHALQHTVAVILGFVLIIAGLAMTFSIVFMLPGMFVLAIGVATSSVASGPTRPLVREDFVVAKRRENVSGNTAAGRTLHISYVPASSPLVSTCRF